MKKLQIKTGQIIEIEWPNGKFEVGKLGFANPLRTDPFPVAEMHLVTCPLHSLMNPDNAKSVTLTDCYSIQDWDNESLFMEGEDRCYQWLELSDYQRSRIVHCKWGEGLEEATKNGNTFDLYWTGENDLKFTRIGDQITFNYKGQVKRGRLRNWKIQDQFICMMVIANGTGELHEVMGVDEYDYSQGYAYVRINEHYTATIMSPLALTDYIAHCEAEGRGSDIDWENFCIVKLGDERRKGFHDRLTQAVMRERAKRIPFNAGDQVDVYANQGVRDGLILDVKGGYVLLSYEMPNGSVSCRQYTVEEFQKHDASGLKTDWFNKLPNKYSTVSQAQMAKSKRWKHIEWLPFGGFNNGYYPAFNEDNVWAAYQPERYEAKVRRAKGKAA